MAKPLTFHVVKRQIIDNLIKDRPVPQEFLNNYLASRPDILSDGFCDIFQHNCRSATQRWSAFELFKYKEIDGDKCDFLVFPFWLELFEAAECRENIKVCIDWLRTTFFNTVPIVIQWNHDIDGATVPELQNLPENFFVLQFNTFKPTKNDILLPFWTINTNPPGVDIKPKYLAGFTGYGGTPLRRQLRETVQAMPDFQWSEERLSEHDYFVQMCQSQFSLCPRGGGLSSYRVYESIQAERPPVIFGDDAALPYPNMDWESFSLRIKERDIDKKLRNKMLMWERYMRLRDWDQMQASIRTVKPRFSLWGVQMEIHHRISEFLK